MNTSMGIWGYARAGKGRVGVIGWLVMAVAFVCLGIIMLLDLTTSVTVAFILPFVALAVIFDQVGFLLDFRVWYLVGVCFFTANYSIPQVPEGSLDSVACVVYLACVAIASVLPLLFYSRHREITLLCKAALVDGRLVPSGRQCWIFATVLAIGLASALYPADSSLGFVVGYFAKGPWLAAMAACGAGIAAGRQRSVWLWLAPISLSYAVLSLFAGHNRTAIVMPLAAWFVGYLAVALLPSQRSAGGGNWVTLLRILPVGGAVLVAFWLGDLQKKAAMSAGDMFRRIQNGDAIEWVDGTVGTYYLQSGRAKIAYFDSLLGAFQGPKSVGHNALQIITTPLPRRFFPDKPDYDVSRVAWSIGALPQPLYFEIFLEQILDSGIVGVMAYHLLFLGLGWCGQRWLELSCRGGGLLVWRVGLYVVICITLAYVVRGPVIVLSWFVMSNIVLFPMFWVSSRLARHAPVVDYRSAVNS